MRPNSLQQRYKDEFASGLLNPNQETPQCVTAHNGKGTEKRYNVYRNNVTSSLVTALGDIFAATLRLVGENFFREMARSFIRQNPPSSPLIFQLGHDFPDFIRHYQPAESVPYLGDVAAIERAWLDAYHAANAAPLAPDALAAISPEKLGDLVFQPHPATQLIESSFAAISIFSVNRAGDDPSKINPFEAECGLIIRPELETKIMLLPQDQMAFISHLFSTKPLGEAAQLTLEAHPNFDLASAIGRVMQSGAFAHITLEN